MVTFVAVMLIVALVVGLASFYNELRKGNESRDAVRGLASLVVVAVLVLGLFALSSGSSPLFEHNESGHSASVKS